MVTISRPTDAALCPGTAVVNEPETVVAPKLRQGFSLRLLSLTMPPLVELLLTVSDVWADGPATPVEQGSIIVNVESVIAVMADAVEGDPGLEGCVCSWR